MYHARELFHGAFADLGEGEVGDVGGTEGGVAGDLQGGPVRMIGEFELERWKVGSRAGSASCFVEKADA